jgi:dCTP deaminase
MSLLSKPAILRHLEAGNIVIHPFSEASLKTASYDVALGEYYYRPQGNEGGRRLFNPYNEADVARIWGTPQQARPLREWLRSQQDSGGLMGLKGIDPDSQVIIIPPGEMFLCHTQEFIGGRRCVTTEMKARSSAGRVFLSVCKCAGWGDVGYFNRWTMEIGNGSPEYHLILVVGYRYAQIAFHEVEALPEDYASDGKYQGASELGALKRSWKPEMMLPRLWNDREAQDANWDRMALELDLAATSGRRHDAMPMPTRHGLHEG